MVYESKTEVCYVLRFSNYCKIKHPFIRQELSTVCARVSRPISVAFKFIPKYAEKHVYHSCDNEQYSRERPSLGSPAASAGRGWDGALSRGGWEEKEPEGPQGADRLAAFYAHLDIPSSSRTPADERLPCGKFRK